MKGFWLCYSNHAKRYDTITNYFKKRATNASAESFNAKVKAFRAQFREVRVIPFLFIDSE